MRNFMPLCLLLFGCNSRVEVAKIPAATNDWKPLTNTIFIGDAAKDKASWDCIAIGNSAESFGTNAIAIGSNSLATGYACIAIGNGSENTNAYHIVIKFDDGSVWESDLPHKPIFTKEHPFLIWNK